MANETGTYDPEKLKLDNEKAAYALASQQQTAGQSQPYQAYDYSGVINRANQAPVQHQNYDYGKSLGYADRRMQTNNMGQATSLGDVRNQINQAASSSRYYRQRMLESITCLHISLKLTSKNTMVGSA